MNSDLQAARVNKNDEFYTRLSDIETELSHYNFQGKAIYCPCDNPLQSQFYAYFFKKFSELQLSLLITTHLGGRYKRVYDGVNETDTPLQGDGDFRSDECKAILDQADIVITNPPFSLFREFVALLEEKQKQFLIIGNMNAITYKECFKLIKDNKMRLGVNNNKRVEFRLHNSYTKWERIDAQGNKYATVPSICWFTTLTHNRCNQPMDLNKSYSATQYPKYDNYLAFEVSRTVNIPRAGAIEVELTEDEVNKLRVLGAKFTVINQGDSMKRYLVRIDEPVYGVPLTFLDKYCPAQFDIVGTQRWFYDTSLGITGGKTLINGKETYDRIFIKHRKIP